METAASSVINDEGLAPEQSDPGVVEGDTVSCVTLPDPCVNIREEVEKVVEEVVGPHHGPVTSKQKSDNSMAYQRQCTPVRVHNQVLFHLSISLLVSLRVW